MFRRCFAPVSPLTLHAVIPHSIRHRRIHDLLWQSQGPARLPVNPSISSLVLSSIISVVQYLQRSVRQFTEVEKLEEETLLHTANVAGEG